MATIPVEIQYNQWACALACYVWCMKRYGATNLTQADFVRTNRVHYWEWHSNNREGLLSAGNLYDLMRASHSVRKCLCTNSVQDCHDYLNKHYQNGVGYLGGYILTRKPTNHCLAVDTWDGQVVNVMNPSPQNGGFQTLQWVDLEKNSDADFLFFFR